MIEIPMAAKDPPYAGFTAVNGEARRQSAAAASWASPPETRPSDGLGRDETQPQDPAHAKSPVAANASHLQAEPDLKRRRVDAEDRDHDAERPRTPWTSPPRLRSRDASPRYPGPLVNPDFSGTTNGAEDHEERARIPSPPRAWNKGSAPKQAQPETEAALAEGLAQALRKSNPNLPPGPTGTQSSSPDRANGASVHEVADEDDDDPNDRGDDDQGDGDQDHAEGEKANPDPSKKRKRIFSQRTKTGCLTCRSRKKKCDEGKPFCHNCERGNFQCQGYGAKPITFKAPTSAGPRHAVTLQSKPPLDHQPYSSIPAPPSHHPGGPPPPPPPSLPPEPHGYPFLHAPPPSHETLPPYPLDGRPPFRDPWGEQYWQHHPALPTHPPPPPSESRQSRYSLAPEPPHPRDTAPMPPILTHASERWQAPRPPAPPASLSLPPLPPSFRSADPWSTSVSSYRSDTAPSLPKPRSSYTGSGSQRGRAAHLSLIPGVRLSEKQKMLIGKPFSPFFDRELKNDREQCHHAVDEFNDARRSGSEIADEDTGRRFRAIIDPSWRKTVSQPGHRPSWHNTQEPFAMGELKGNVGQSTQVEAPFRCDYGYNIVLGDRVYIGRGCTMEDACKITIGNSTIIGTDVKFITQTASILQSVRGDGVMGELIGGAITVGAGCFIGDNAIILPYRKIGNGAVIGAGSVVVRDVAEYTVVAGNPAKVVRRIERGILDPEHRADIQQQNELMQQEMVEDAKREYDPER